MNLPAALRRNGAAPAPASPGARAPTVSPNGYGPALAARDLWFSYDGRTPVLRGVSMEVRPGALTMVLGRSGSGKTTLLKALHGLVRPQRGAVQLDGDANGRRPRGRVAYVPQTLGLVRSMTALENTLAGALGYTGTVRSLLKLFPRETTERANRTLASLGLAHKVHEKVYSLSGGERQRVAIARALMQRPDVILADEFVSQLDPVTALETLDVMRRLAHDGVGFLITTHETDIVAQYADHVVIMQQGRVIHDGPAGALPEPTMLELLA